LAFTPPYKMTKRKKATTAPSHPTRGGHLLGPPREASTARASAPAQPVETPSTTAAPRTSLVLAAECLVSGASTLKESLASLLDEPQPITLDITALQRIDTAGLQVLTAFIRERTAHGRTVEWRGISPALRSAAHLLGLTSLLELPA
jgi:ABC-type transporter Mla MlaB component